MSEQNQHIGLEDIAPLVARARFIAKRREHVSEEAQEWINEALDGLEEQLETQKRVIEALEALGHHDLLALAEQMADSFPAPERQDA